MYMRRAEVSLTALYLTILSFSGFIVPYIEPQLAGLWGSGMYLIVRHESKTATLSISSLFIVLIMGYTGAWAVVHVGPVLYDLHDVYIKVISFTVGFMMYDFYMAWGNNTKSVIGMIINGLNILIKQVIKKWSA